MTYICPKLVRSTTFKRRQFCMGGLGAGIYATAVLCSSPFRCQSIIL